MVGVADNKDGRGFVGIPYSTVLQEGQDNFETNVSLSSAWGTLDD